MRVRLALWLSVLVPGVISASTALAQPVSMGAGVTPSAELFSGSVLEVAPTFAPDVAPTFRSASIREPTPTTAAGAWRASLFAVPAAGAPAPILVSTDALMLLADAQAAQRPRPAAFEYSEGYQTRRKIHVYASLAMLPLFVTQFALGNSLWDNSTEGKRTAHAVVGSSIGVLFGLNTVTGVWNLWEGRKNPVGKTRRLTHGLLMLGADAGFFATALLAPGDGGEGDRDTHRAVALTSMGVATASYLFMLFTR
jgi:hypothetical protein